jgi:hypothetical protein
VSRTIEEIEAARSARKAALAEQKQAQLAVDMEALDALEQEHGDGRVAAVSMPTFSPGLPALIVVRTPKPVEYKRYQDMAAKDSGRKTCDVLADVCVVYPDRETYAKMREIAPGIHAQAYVKAVRLAEGRNQEEGKG